MFISVKCICYLFIYFYALARVSSGYIWFGFLPSVVWRLRIDFSVTLGVGKLALNRQSSYIHTCIRCYLRILAYWAGIWRIGMAGCMPVHLSVCSDIFMSICASVCQLVHLYICCYICTSVSGFICPSVLY